MAPAAGSSPAPSGGSSPAGGSPQVGRSLSTGAGPAAAVSLSALGSLCAGVVPGTVAAAGGPLPGLVPQVVIPLPGHQRRRRHTVMAAPEVGGRRALTSGGWCEKLRFVGIPSHVINRNACLFY